MIHCHYAKNHNLTKVVVLVGSLPTTGPGGSYHRARQHGVVPHTGKTAPNATGHCVYAGVGSTLYPARGVSLFSLTTFQLAYHPRHRVTAHATGA